MKLSMRAAIVIVPAHGSAVPLDGYRPSALALFKCFTGATGDEPIRDTGLGR